MHVVSGVEAAIHPFPIPRDPTFDEEALTSRLHHKLLNIVHHFRQVHAEL